MAQWRLTNCYCYWGQKVLMHCLQKEAPIVQPRTKMSTFTSTVTQILTFWPLYNTHFYAQCETLTPPCNVHGSLGIILQHSECYAVWQCCIVSHGVTWCDTLRLKEKNQWCSLSVNLTAAQVSPIKLWPATVAPDSIILFAISINAFHQNFHLFICHRHHQLASSLLNFVAVAYQSILQRQLWFSKLSLSIFNLGIQTFQPFCPLSQIKGCTCGPGPHHPYKAQVGMSYWNEASNSIITSV